MIRKLGTPIVIFITFWIVAIVLWQTKGQIFFLYNFGYIGSAIGVGIGLYVLLPRKKGRDFGFVFLFARLDYGVYCEQYCYDDQHQYYEKVCCLVGYAVLNAVDRAFYTR